LEPLHLKTIIKRLKTIMDKSLPAHLQKSSFYAKDQLRLAITREGQFSKVSEMADHLQFSNFFYHFKEFSNWRLKLENFICRLFKEKYLSSEIIMSHFCYFFGEENVKKIMAKKKSDYEFFQEELKKIFKGFIWIYANQPPQNGS